MVRLFVSDRILVDSRICNGGIVVNDYGKIEEVFKNEVETSEWLDLNQDVDIFDCNGLVIMPGLIDSHVHINEPGRTEWEGFETATKAAAAGGFTTIVDMPLNSIPPTTTVNNLLVKQKATHGKICVDVGFWGGIIPGNHLELPKLVDHGVVGFKCFLCPSGVDEFPVVTEQDVELAYEQLNGSDGLIAFHAEKCEGNEGHCAVDENGNEMIDSNGDVHEFKTYLQTRPAHLEVNAIEMVVRLAEKYDNIRTHIVHLSAAEALPLIRNFRQSHDPNRLTVETCHHYLNLSAEHVPKNRVDFKCCPPIRDAENQKALWNAIKTGEINMVVSDHSPSTAEMKLLNSGPDCGNFMKSWGGISSIQFGLSLFWTNCKQYGMGINDMIRLMCEEPAKLCRFDDRKGKLCKGYDADLCIWDPTAEFTVTSDIIHFRNKANPYMGKQLKGVVHATIVRGQFAYKRSKIETFNCVGRLLKRTDDNIISDGHASLIQFVNSL